MEIVNSDIFDHGTMRSISCVCMKTHRLPKVTSKTDNTRKSAFVDESEEDEEGRRDSDEEDDVFGQHTTPLFKLEVGVAASSDGIPCAAAAGVSTFVLQRALT